MRVPSMSKRRRRFCFSVMSGSNVTLHPFRSGAAAILRACPERANESNGRHLLMFQCSLNSEIFRDSSTSVGMTKRKAEVLRRSETAATGLRRAHEQNRDHAAEKCNQLDRGDAKNDKTSRIVRCRARPERSRVSETGGPRARL